MLTDAPERPEWEYKVRCVRGSGTWQLERVCNDLAKFGWRFMWATAAADSPLDVRVWMFFGREAIDPEPCRRSC